jgi:hypothetical protein
MLFGLLESSSVIDGRPTRLLLTLIFLLLMLAIPENHAAAATTWTMMLLGFGAIGVIMRGNRKGRWRAQ